MKMFNITGKLHILIYI